MSTTDTYYINEVEKYRSTLGIDDVRPPFNDYEVEFLLRTVKCTAAGCDNLPAWLFRQCFVEFFRESNPGIAFLIPGIQD